MPTRPPHASPHLADIEAEFPLRSRWTCDDDTARTIVGHHPGDRSRLLVESTGEPTPKPLTWLTATQARNTLRAAS